MDKLLKEFDADMMNIYHEAKRRCSYTPSQYFNMLIKLKGLGTAKRLLYKDGTSYGFTQLHLCGCLDLTVECLILRPKYQGLFEEAELEEARKRLNAHHFDPAKCEC